MCEIAVDITRGVGWLYLVALFRILQLWPKVGMAAQVHASNRSGNVAAHAPLLAGRACLCQDYNDGVRQEGRKRWREERGEGGMVTTYKAQVCKCQPATACSSLGAVCMNQQIRQVGA